MIRRFVVVALVVLAATMALSARAQNAANGEVLYRAYCSACHSVPPSSARQPVSIRAAMTIVPDMRFLSFLTDAEVSDIAAWVARVLDPVVSNPTGLWWTSGENGWGMNFNLQAGLLFGALYTYDTDGSPLWLVLSVGQGSGGSYTGPLFRATGPAFNASPWVWDPATMLQQVGTMTASFSSSDAGTLSYTVNGAQVNKTITRFRFGTPPYTTCSAASSSRAGLTNYQDLWENAPGGSEPGWGLNVAHEDDIISANLYTYDATGKGLWLILSNAPKQADGSYTGALYSVRGPAFNTAPWPAAGTVVTQVGTMTLRFTNGETGTMSYTVNGVAVSKNITRSIFAPSSRPACQ